MARARSQHPPRPWTVDEFLEWERQQPERYEYVGGMIVMMVGGTSDHHTISGNVFAALRSALRGSGCRAYVEGMKVDAGEGAAYPDVVVTCSKVAPKQDVVAEPVIIVEVLSRSTETFDRGAKWLAYQTLPSLRQYVLVSQDEMKVEVFERDAQSWLYRLLDDPKAGLAFAVGGCTMTLAEIYEETSLDPTAKAG
jgi:Uma2 family endonuclease